MPVHTKLNNASQKCPRTGFEAYFSRTGSGQWKGIFDGVEMSLSMALRPLDSQVVKRKFNATHYIDVEISGHHLTCSLIRQVSKEASLLAPKLPFKIRVAGSPPNFGLLVKKCKILADFLDAGFSGVKKSKYSDEPQKPKSRGMPHAVSEAYEYFEANENTPWSVIEKTRRSLFQRYHPDKVASKGSNIEKQANMICKKINLAFNLIRAHRGIRTSC